MTSSDFSDRVRNYPSARHGPLAHREKYRPGQLEKINDRKAAFDRLNRFIMARGGWITSIPGDRLVVVEAVSATTASDLADLGYSPVEIEGGRGLCPPRSRSALPGQRPGRWSHGRRGAQGRLPRCAAMPALSRR